jgi:hypothetical protein
MIYTVVILELYHKRSIIAVDPFSEEMMRYRFPRKTESERTAQRQEVLEKYIAVCLELKHAASAQEFKRCYSLRLIQVLFGGMWKLQELACVPKNPRGHPRNDRRLAS